MSPQLGGLGPKAEELMIPFRLGKGEPISDFHLRYIAIIIELLLMRYKTVYINNLTGKNIMELSKLKLLQIYMTPLELNYRSFERPPQSQQLSLIFTQNI